MRFHRTNVKWLKEEFATDAYVDMQKGPEHYNTFPMAFDWWSVQSLDASPDVQGWTVVNLNNGARYLVPEAFEPLFEEWVSSTTERYQFFN